MSTIISITLKGIFRDRIFQGIMALAVLFLVIPSAASLSMRQVTELSITIKMASFIYPPARPLLWSAIVAAIVFDALKYIIVVAVTMLLATISTSFFLPVFGAISTYLAGTITQQVYDYLQTPSAQTSVSAIVRKAALLFYYLLPNLSGFDLKVHAIYALPINVQGLILTLLYFVVYTGIVLCVGTLLFARREMK